MSDNDVSRNLKRLVPTSKEVRVDLDDIWVNRQENIRRLESYTEDDKQSMIRQITAVGGLIHPLMLAPIDPNDPATDNKHYTLLDGFRRVAGLAELAQLDPQYGKDLKATVVDEADTTAAVRMVQLITALSRRDLEPMEKAVAIKEALNDKTANMSQRNVAEILGISEENVSQLLKLLQLTKEIQQMLNDGEITFSHARIILNNVPNTRWNDAAKAAKGMTVTKFTKMVEDNYGATPSDKTEDGKEGEGDKTEGDASEAKAATSGQKRPSMIRSGELEKTYLPFLKDKLEKANKEAKSYTEADLVKARLDTISTVMLQAGTDLSKDIAPFIEKQKATEDAEEAAEERKSNFAKLLKTAVKEVATALSAPPDPANPGAARPSLAQIASSVTSRVGAMSAEEKVKNGVEGEFKPEEFVKLLITSYGEHVKKVAESKKKREETEAAKKAEEAKKAAEGNVAAAQAAATPVGAGT